MARYGGLCQLSQEAYQEGRYRQPPEPFLGFRHQ